MLTFTSWKAIIEHQRPITRSLLTPQRVRRRRQFVAGQADEPYCGVQRHCKLGVVRQLEIVTSNVFLSTNELTTCSNPCTDSIQLQECDGMKKMTSTRKVVSFSSLFDCVLPLLQVAETVSCRSQETYGWTSQKPDSMVQWMKTCKSSEVHSLSLQISMTARNFMSSIDAQCVVIQDSKLK